MNVEMQKRGGQSVPVNPSSAPGREEQNRTGMEGKTHLRTHTDGFYCSCCTTNIWQRLILTPVIITATFFFKLVAPPFISNYDDWLKSFSVI